MKKRLFWVAAALTMIAVALVFFWRNHVNHSEEALLQRVNEYWEAIKVNDLYTAYHLEAETASGNLLPHEVEVRREWGMQIVDFTLGDVTMYGDNAEIKVNTTMTMAEFEGRTFPGGVMTDTWVFMKGKWYHGWPEKGGAAIRKKPDPFARRSLSGSQDSE